MIRGLKAHWARLLANPSPLLRVFVLVALCAAVVVFRGLYRWFMWRYRAAIEASGRSSIQIIIWWLIGTLYPPVLTLILKEQVCVQTPNPAITLWGFGAALSGCPPTELMNFIQTYALTLCLTPISVTNWVCWLRPLMLQHTDNLIVIWLPKNLRGNQFLTHHWHNK